MFIAFPPRFVVELFLFYWFLLPDCFCGIQSDSLPFISSTWTDSVSNVDDFLPFISSTCYLNFSELSMFSLLCKTVLFLEPLSLHLLVSCSKQSHNMLELVSYAYQSVNDIYIYIHIWLSLLCIIGANIFLWCFLLLWCIRGLAITWQCHILKVV